MNERPEETTCETCDWWCYGTWPSNTCDKWEYTICEIEVPDEVIARLTNEPTEDDLRKLHAEIDDMENSG